MQHILIVSKNHHDIEQVRLAFQQARTLKLASDVGKALELLAQRRSDLVFIDIDMLGNGGRYCQETIHSFKNYFPTIEIVVVADKARIRDAVKAVRSGASDYVTRPLDAEEIRHVAECISNEMIVQSELDYFRGQFWKTDALAFIQTNHPAMKKVYELIRLVAPTRATVLLAGETGTGKGVLASLIHRHSNREQGRFISVHCGAIPETLVESELFGHEKGAFTGAVRRKLGKFEIARQGSIFLDEIATLTPSAQIKLLQVLQDGTFSRVGGEDIIQTDARVIAAANMDLKAMCDQGTFRRDLYFRLNVFPIEIPPLRERAEDIPILAEVFLARLNARMNRSIKAIHPDVIAAMKRYAWPGNIRELENILERAYILETADTLTPLYFPQELLGNGPYRNALAVDAKIPIAEARRGVLEEFEQQYLRLLLTRNKGRVNKSAEDAGITTRQFHKLITRYGIIKEEFKA
ncbi:MAG: sigma-54-dependent Fis family transcriptional regulator [Desulfobacteraceae bacterium]|jgi:DNA-binding NtrC family response regulator|nr:MAG: sigma-54-dependent Fis family transcriptional regulator [Desulfobacteraceae bacterium]